MIRCFAERCEGEYRMFTRKDLDDDPYAASGNRTGGLLRLGFYGLVFTVLATVYALSQFRGLREPVAMECAQIARHLAEGRGFVTDCTRPFDLWYLQSHDRLPPPDASFPVL